MIKTVSKAGHKVAPSQSRLFIYFNWPSGTVTVVFCRDGVNMTIDWCYFINMYQL